MWLLSKAVKKPFHDTILKQSNKKPALCYVFSDFSSSVCLYYNTKKAGEKENKELTEPRTPLKRTYLVVVFLKPTMWFLQAYNSLTTGQANAVWHPESKLCLNDNFWNSSGSKSLEYINKSGEEKT